MMYLRKLLTTFILALLSLLAVLPSGIALAADGGLSYHENPDTAALRFDDIAILGYYSRLLDTVIARAPSQVEWLREKTPFANIPEALEGSLQGFGDASVRISWLILEIEADLDNLDSLARQFRLEEMEAQRQQTRDKLTRAYGELSVIEESALTAEAELGVPPRGSDGLLRVAYEALESRIDRLHRLLDLFQELLKALPEASLQELLKALPETSLEELLRSVLRPTEITLAVEPTVAFVGDWLHFEGRLTSGGAGLPNREVVLLLDGVPYLRTRSGPDGSYQGQLQVPYSYVPRLTLQALYYPQDGDIGAYLASKSPPIELQVLFYTARLHLEVKGKSYPGLESTLYGRFDYGDQPAPAARDVHIYLDDRLASQVGVGVSFEEEIALGPETALGEHRLSVIAPAQQRYAPVAAETTLNVIKAVPVIEVTPPRVAIMPLALNLEGRIYSELGPVQGAVVKASFRDRQAEAITSPDGVFTVKLGTGMNLSLIGSQELVLRVNPGEPWNSPASSSWSLVTVNPIFIALAALALGLIIVASAKRLRARLTRPVPRAAGTGPGVPAIEPAEEVGAGVSFPTPPQRARKDLRQLTFELYGRLLRLVQEFTHIALKPHLTLREFVAQCAPALGPAHRHLDQFTRLIERFLYSPHPPQPADLEKGRELSRSVEESLEP